MLSGIDLFRLAGDRMRYLTERQTVIARNIANADTPGYKAQDLTPFSVAGTQANGTAGGGPLALARTQASHVAATNSSSTAVPAQVVETDSTYAEKSSGNTVSLEEQMVKSADVGNAFSLATAAYAKSVSLLKIAIDSGR